MAPGPFLSAHRGISLRYAIDPRRASAGLASTFRPLELDASTRAWLDDAIDRPTAAPRLLARRVARSLMGDYDANALFDTHDMRVLGREQWALLLDSFASHDQGSVSRWLDVGAGDGRVTAELAPLARVVETTETSHRMAKRLRERGFVCHEVDLVTSRLETPERYDVISALNVLDRTARPYTLVERMMELLAPSGRLVLSAPLPLAPHVHVGNATLDPDELLPIDRRSFEQAATTLVETALLPLGLELLAWTRVPYLSRGDANVPVYVLDDAVFVLGRRSTR